VGPFRGPRISAAFLDRDGTINVKAEVGGYIRDPRSVVLLPGAADAIRRLNEARIATILVTNQRWLSEPDVSPAAYAAVHARVEELLARERAQLDASYHCPHRLRSCDCRKPRPGMLLAAAADLHLELTASVMIGDTELDVAAGHAAGVRTVLVGEQSGGLQGRRPDAFASDLSEAVDLVVGTGGIA